MYTYFVSLTLVSNRATSMFFVHRGTAGHSHRTPGPYALLTAFDAVTILAQTGTVHRRAFRVNRTVYHAAFFFFFSFCFFVHRRINAHTREEKRY